jgi:signal transduction histidine kinase
MSSTAATGAEGQRALHDPVLLAPAIVAVGLSVGWFGIRNGVAGTRIAVDLALAWALVASSIVALERERWRPSRILLAAAGFAVLAADLQWTSSRTLWTLGLLIDLLWVALLVQVVLRFPEGRAWSPAAQFVIVCAYGAALGGQLVAALLLHRSVISVASHESVADAAGRVERIAGIAVGVALLVLVVPRLVRLQQRSVQRAQAPFLAGGIIAVATTLVWFAWTQAFGTGVAAPLTIGHAAALLIPLGLVIGIGWSRAFRREASHLVVELRTGGAATLRDRLARSLDDPTLEVAYRLDNGGYVDAEGRSVELPEGLDRAVTLITAQGDDVAALVHDPALLDEPALVESVRATAGLVLENERLAAQVRAQLAEVRASRAGLFAATDTERRRLERDLHDGAQQRLVALSISLGLAASRADSPEVEVLSRAQDELEEAIAELREFARGIHPMLLREEGLDAAVESLARRTPLTVIIEGSAGNELPDAVELAAYFVVSEALTNVVKHAAASEVRVRLERDRDMLLVEVQDDGVGGAGAASDSGLAGLEGRLAALDARLVIESNPGHGTRLRTEIPCGS